MAWSFSSETNPAMSMAATSPACHVAPGRPERVAISDDGAINLLPETAVGVPGAPAGGGGWGRAGVGDGGAVGSRGGQYLRDLVADAAALNVLGSAGVGILSEESGLDGGERELVVVVDPLDGSTNAARGIPWF